jgi:hypothetical protein
MARQVIGDALFVASDTEPNWGKAHRILMPGTFRRIDIVSDSE